MLIVSRSSSGVCRFTSRRGRSRGVAAIAVASLASAGALTRDASAQTNNLWNGSVSSAWGGANWTTTNSSGLPATNNTLEFATGSSFGTALSDNLMTPAAFNVSGITFDSTAPAYVIAPASSGTNGFTLTGSITNNSASLQTINDPVALGTSSATAGSGNMSFGGVISGASTTTMTFGDTGTTTLNALNSFSGNAVVNSGIVIANVSNTALTNTVSTPNAGALGATDTAHTITVNSGGTLSFGQSNVLGANNNTLIQTSIVLNSGGTLTNSGGVFSTVGLITLNGGTLTSTGGGNAITGVTAPQAWYLRGNGNNGVILAGGNATSTISGTGSVGLTSTPSTFNVSTGSTLNVSASLTNSATNSGASGLVKIGGGSMLLSGTNYYQGQTNVSQGTFSVSGTLGGNGGAGILVVGNTANAPATLKILPGASLVFSSVNALVGNVATSPGAIYQTGGTMSGLAQLQLGDITGGSYGYYSLSGTGSVASMTELDDGGFNGAAVGVVDLAGGTMNTSAWITMARGTAGTGILNVLGGTLNQTSTASGQFQMNWGGAATSVINIGSGGNLNAPGQILNTMSTGAAGALGSVNLLSGGTLKVLGIAPGSATGTSLVNFNGGTLKANTASNTFLTSANITAVSVYSGGGTIDNNGVNINISTGLLAPAGSGVTFGTITPSAGGSGYVAAPAVTFSSGGGTGATGYATVSNGVVTGVVVTNPGYNYSSAPIVNFLGGGGSGASATSAITPNASGPMTFAGAGTTTLNGTNTYAGTTNVSAGTVLLNGTLTTSSVWVAASAIFGGTGNVLTLYNQAAGTLAPGGVGTIGVFNLSGGAAFSGGTIAVDLGSALTSDLVNVTGNLTITGLTKVSPNLLSGFTTGSYDIMNISSGSVSGTSYLVPASRAAAISTATVGSTTQVLLNYNASAPAAYLNWNSSSSGNWDVITSQNWFNTGANAQDYYYQADNVTFPDGALQSNINLTTALAPGSVTVSSNAPNYNFGGTGSISGSTGLTKTGNSVLTLSNTNTFTGTANISAGSVVATGANSLGTGALNIGTGAVVSFVGNATTTGTIGNSSIVDNGSLVLNESANYDPVTISGTGSVTTNNASGGVSFPPTDNYSGGTYITAGANYMGFGGTAAYTAGYANGALGTGPVNLSGGTLTISYYAPVIANNFNIGNATLHVGFQQTAVLTGTINLTGPVTFACDGGTNFDLTGPMYNTAGNTTTVNYGNGLTIATTAVLFSNTSSISINSDTLTLAPPMNSNYSIPSVISSTGTSPVVMAGPGVAVLSASNTYSGGTTISGGILVAANSNALSSGAVALNGGVNVNAELALPGGVNISNAISVGGRTAAYGPYLDNISGNNTVSGPIGLYTSGNMYAIESDAGLLTIAGQITQQAGAGTRYYVFQGAGNGLVATPIINGTAVPVVEMNGTGTWTFAGNNSYGGVTQVNSGTLAFAPNYSSGIQVITLSGGLNISNGAMVRVNAAASSATRSLLLTSSLSIASATGKLDLSNNDLDVQGGTLSTINALVAQGYNGGSWNTTGGIVSAAAANDSTHLTALGAIQNSLNQNSGTILYSTFDGVAVADTDVLVKYTYYGDANLDGKVDGSDYSLVDTTYMHENFANGVATSPVSGWYNGDFNYDNVVDGSDYTLMDNAFNTQGTQISAQLATPTALLGGSGGGAAVPEPTALALLGIGAIGLLGRRRSQRN